MLEIEQKFAQPDFPALERKLAAWGVTNFEEHLEADHYFNAPDRDFGTTGEAFRLRKMTTGTCLTYKGPKLAGPVKARTEIEVPLGNGDQATADMESLLKLLGYRPVAIVRKQRRTCQLERGGFHLAVCLDEVEGLGRFAEVEVLAPEEQLSTARDVLLAVAKDLGLNQVEPRAYLTMLLEETGQ